MTTLATAVPNALHASGEVSGTGRSIELSKPTLPNLDAIVGEEYLSEGGIDRIDQWRTFSNSDWARFVSGQDDFLQCLMRTPERVRKEALKKGALQELLGRIPISVAPEVQMLVYLSKKDLQAIRKVT